MATAAALLASVLVGQPNNVLLVYMDDLRTNVDGTEVSDHVAALNVLLPCCVHVQILFSRMGDTAGGGEAHKQGVGCYSGVYS